MLIRKEAEGIETYETNRNLVLTDGCRADSVPNLEIETGEIEGAGHASTTGRFDDEQLFYLGSRGIPEDEARRLVVHGFFADIIRRIGVPEIQTPAAGRGRDRARGHRGTAAAGQPGAAWHDVHPRLRPRRPPDGKPLAVEVAGVEIALVRQGDEVFAIRDECSPRRDRAVRGRRRGLHASSAGCTARASTCAPAPPSACRPPSRSPVYPVRIDGDDVLVDVNP